MSELPVPIPKQPIAIRVANLGDLSFIDELHKKYGKALGYWPTKQFEAYINAGAVLMAECPHPGPLTGGEGERRVGYVISKDRYLKRDELGVVYQLCVAPSVQRGLIGASLVRAVFERASYGCRLFCLWCAQDLSANEFWEAMGFVPLAFRAGSDRKKRVHIFWQKRIVEEDVETKWWYPCKTENGALRADRLVWPIPPGVHWRDVRAVEVPGMVKSEACALPSCEHGLQTRDTGKVSGPGPGKVGILVGGRIKYIDRPGAPCPAVALLVPLESETVALEVPPPGRRPRAKRCVPKVDPALVAKVRELRDRCLERVNDEPHLLESRAKYAVARLPLTPAPTPLLTQTPPLLLPAA